MNEQENIEKIFQCPVCGLEFLDSDLMKHEAIHFVSPEDDYEAGFKAGRQDELAHLASLAPEDALLKDVEILVYFHPYDYSELIDLKKLLKAQLAKVWPIAQAKIERTKKLAEAEGYLKGQRAERERTLALWDEIICPMCYRLNPQHASMDHGKGCHWCQEREDWLKSGKMPEEAKSDLA